MSLAALLLGIALAEPTDLPTDTAPSVGVHPLEGGEAPWHDYRLHNVLHPSLDKAFLAQWEPAFRRRNRLAGAGVAMVVGGVGVALTGILGGVGQNERATAVFGLGAAMVVAGPIVGAAGTSGAAKVLRASGIPVRRDMATGALVVLSGSLLFPPALTLGIPTAVILTVVQAEINGAAFRRIMQRPPARLAVLPLAAGAPGLTLAATW